MVAYIFKLVIPMVTIICIKKKRTEHKQASKISISNLMMIHLSHAQYPERLDFRKQHFISSLVENDVLLCENLFYRLKNNINNRLKLLNFTPVETFYTFYTHYTNTTDFYNFTTAISVTFTLKTHKGLGMCL